MRHTTLRRAARIASTASALAIAASALLAPTSQAAASSSTQRALAGGLGAARGACYIANVSAGTTHAWDGSQPAHSCGRWTFRLPATHNPPSTRRSELWWSKDAATNIALHKGDLLTYEDRVTAHLGGAGASNNDWHLLWQLHGPTNGVWSGPAMSLSVRDGQLFLTGGSGHPKHSRQTYYQWFKNLATYRDGRTYKFKIQTYLTPYPDSAWISVWIDGKQVLHKWQPVSSYGHRSGTLNPGQPEVAVRSGLYRGTGDGYPRPTTSQWAIHEGIIVK